MTTPSAYFQTDPQHPIASVPDVDRVRMRHEVNTQATTTARESLREKVAIIGSVGIPNRYGGPEAFAESIAPALLDAGYEVIVTCDKARYLDDLSSEFRGVRRTFVPIGANGATSPLHDLVAFLRVVRTCDYILVLGVSAGLFFPLFRLICAWSGARLLVNVDGVEWRRSKFGALQKLALYCFDWLAQQFAHVVIYDNDALLPFVLRPRKSVCVEYSGDHALAGRSQAARAAPQFKPEALTICRIEPENNCDLLLEGFLRSNLSSYVFVGNWDRSEYGRALRQKYASESRVRLLDPIYDSAVLFELRSSCKVYLHGHSVGGTNPSLVEILFFDCEVFCWDCSFNRATAGESAHYFSTPEELATLLNAPRTAPGGRSILRERYSTKAILDKLVAAFRHAP